MVSFAELRDCDPAGLAAAGQVWLRLADQLGYQGEAFTAQVRRVAEASHWSGDAAVLAAEKLRRTDTGLDAARTETHAIATELLAAADNIATAKRRLLAVIEEAGHGGYRIDETGQVHPPARAFAAEEAAKPEHTALLRKETEAAAEYARRIAQALRQASDADELAAHALARDLGDSRTAFNAAAQDSGSADDAAMAADLVRKGQLGEADRRALHALLAANSGTPDFADRLMRSIGPKGLLDFSKAISTDVEHPAGSPERPPVDPLLRDIQADLGKTLATASPRLDAAWVNELKAHGRTLETGDARQGPTSWYGYQSLGNLLRHGQYDPGFLQNVGTNMVAFERKYKASHDDFSPWPGTGMTAVGLHGTHPNLGATGGTGLDPIDGLMEGLAHSPRAAEQFLTTGDNLKYLLKDRSWYDGHDSIGHAIEGATTHSHSRESAQVTADTVRLLAEGGKKDIPAELRDSLGKMFAHHIEDVNTNLGPGGERQVAGVTQGRDSGEFVAKFGRAQLIDVLGKTVENADAHVAVTNAEIGYTQQRMNQLLGDESRSMKSRSEELQNLTDSSSSVFGQLDQAYSGGLKEKHEEYTKALERSGTVVKFVGGQIIGTIPYGGDYIKFAFEQGLDHGAGELKKESKEATDRQVAAVYGKGESLASRIAVQAMWDRQFFDDGKAPTSLYSNGKPIPYSQMTIEQYDRFHSWIAGNDPDRGRGVYADPAFAAQYNHASPSYDSGNARQQKSQGMAGD